MNKITKASIATASGVVLLMGGAASLAYWNDSTDLGVDGQTISAGSLSATPVDAGAWTKAFNGGTPAALSNAQLTDVRIVPGDTLEYTQEIEIAAVGDSLYFTVTPTDGAIAGAGGADGALQAILDAHSTFDVAAVSGGSVALTGSTAGVYEVTSNSGAPATVEVTWTIAWPFDEDPDGAGAGISPDVDNAAQGGAVSLTAGALTVTQVGAP